MPQESRIYSACYSNVPVYEFNVEGNHVMRRRADDWINATHILKVADFDKPARTRILEREVQKGVHEKVQGGYGKYQGTWIPLPDGRTLAERNGVLLKLLPIFEYVPGDRSPPPAPKHATAVSNRPRAPRTTAAARRASARVEEDRFSTASLPVYEDDHVGTPDNATIISESVIDDDAFAYPPNPNTLKRKRGQEQQMTIQDRDHQIWADSLLDYFMLLSTSDPFPTPPEPPAGINIDRAIDDKGHTALHWAAAMGDVAVVRSLMGRNARVEAVSNSHETPLMRAVLFTNNYDKDSMPKMIRLLQATVHQTDWFQSTVFHHIAKTTENRTKYSCARYYLDSIINALAETWTPEEITKLLDIRDANGDTAVMIAARNGARKCVRSLLGRNVNVDVPNKLGETADDLIRELNSRRRSRQNHRQASSSPFGPETRAIEDFSRGLNGDGPVSSLPNLSIFTQNKEKYRSQTANTLLTSLGPTLMDRLQQLADACDAELEEKEAEAADADRVSRKRQLEIEALQRQISELNSIDQSDEYDVRHENELAELVAEAEALLEVEQLQELRRLQEHAEANSSQTNGSGESLIEKGRLARQLYTAQDERRRLVRNVVEGLSVAGVGEKTSDYRRLIIGALGVREDDVEALLTEILSQLEDEAQDGGADES